MTYQPFDERVLPIFAYYIALIIFSLIMTLSMTKKWRERKVKAPLYLSIVFILFTVALIVLTIGLAEAVITGYYKEVYRFSLPFGYSMMIIADVFLFIFAKEMTKKGEKALIPLAIIGGIIIFTLFLPWNWWGIPSEDIEGQLNIRLYVTMAVIIYSYIIYLFIANFCLKARAQSDDKQVRAGFGLLVFSMFCMIGFFLMFIFDTLLIVFVDHPGYSEFVYIAWIFAILFFISTYLALVMPDWLTKRLTK